MNRTKLAAFLLALATPLEIWASIELAKSEYIIGVPLMCAAVTLLYRGTITFVLATSDEVEEDIQKEFGDKK